MGILQFFPLLFFIKTAYSQGKMTLLEEKYWLNLEKVLKGILVAQKWKVMEIQFL